MTSRPRSNDGERSKVSLPNGGASGGGDHEKNVAAVRSCVRAAIQVMDHPARSQRIQALDLRAVLGQLIDAAMRLIGEEFSIEQMGDV